MEFKKLLSHRQSFEIVALSIFPFLIYFLFAARRSFGILL